ncbi:hypothetical protein DTL42_17860 [Bremerella cremea]|uniref:Uncharacterized protein n=1 Tax=Bremerella cremea TaxID=1031537 RepID=A0A368KN54_9BACT|nr:hypothetical protein [Bremerella cremea]RCS44177.1 hypothetical protein DTL42_17860 [Bremerella cremea]
MRRFWAGCWVMVLVGLMGWAGFVWGEEAEERLEARIFFTEGAGGPLRESAEFQTEEDPHAFLWITGLRPRPQDHGRASIAGMLSAYKPDGTLLTESPFSADKYMELLGPGAEVIYLQTNVNGNDYSSGPHKIVAEVVHNETGKRVTASREFFIKPVEKLSIIQYEFGYRSDKSISPGMFLQAGRPHVLNLQLLKFGLKDGQARLRISMMGCDQQGQPIQAEPMVQERQLTAEIEEGHYLIGKLSLPFVPNRAGQHFIRVTVDDLNSGEKTTRDIPCPVVSVFGDAEQAVPTPPPGLLWLEACLTNGEHGSLRQGNTYYANDTIYSQIRIAGLKTNAHGIGKLALRVTVSDETGQLLFEKEVEELPYHLMHDRNVFEFSFWQKTNFPETLSGPVTWTLQITDQISGATGYLSKEVVVNPDTQLHATGYEFYLWEDSDIPAGNLFTVGRPYHLRATVVGTELKNSTRDIEVKMIGVDRQGNRLSDFELSTSQPIAFSRFSEPAKNLDIKLPFRLNRSGKYALRLIVTDKHSGQVTSEDIPIEVVGLGPNDLKE